MDDASASEKRGDGRAPIELKVEYKRQNAFFADYTRNISRGGTFIRTTRPLPIGTEFVFKLFVPKLDEPLRLIGEGQLDRHRDRGCRRQPRARHGHPLHLPRGREQGRGRAHWSSA
jgi:uncharacterized protein (TIGR02266 family)